MFSEISKGNSKDPMTIDSRPLSGSQRLLWEPLHHTVVTFQGEKMSVFNSGNGDMSGKAEGFSLCVCPNCGFSFLESC